MRDKVTDEELEACPFCGTSKHLSVMKDKDSEDGKVYAYHVFCGLCHARGRNNYPIGWCESEQAAREAWNHRGSVRPVIKNVRAAQPAPSPAGETKTSVRCNHCMSTFDEDAIIIINDDAEACPVCKKGDALMDIDAAAPSPASVMLLKQSADKLANALTNEDWGEAASASNDLDEILSSKPASIDELLLQGIYSLREKLKIAVAAIKSGNPNFDDREFMHRLGSVEFDQYMEELAEEMGKEAPKPASVQSAEAKGEEALGEANFRNSYRRVRSVGSNWASVGDSEWDANVLADEIDRLNSDRADQRQIGREEAAKRYEGVVSEAKKLLVLMDDVGIDPELNGETDRVFPRYEFEGLRKVLADLKE